MEYEKFNSNKKFRRIEYIINKSVTKTNDFELISDRSSRHKSRLNRFDPPQIDV